MDDFGQYLENIYATIAEEFSGDAPPPPTQEAVEEHNEELRAAGMEDDVIVWDPELAARSREEYERDQRSWLDRLGDSARETRDDVRDAISAARWVSIAVIVLVVVLSVAAVTWWIWIWGPEVAQLLVQTFGGA